MKLRFKQIAYSVIALFLVFEHLVGARILQLLPYEVGSSSPVVSVSQANAAFDLNGKGIQIAGSTGATATCVSEGPGSAVCRAVTGDTVKYKIDIKLKAVDVPSDNTIDKYIFNGSFSSGGTDLKMEGAPASYSMLPLIVNGSSDYELAIDDIRIQEDKKIYSTGGSAVATPPFVVGDIAGASANTPRALYGEVDGNVAKILYLNGSANSQLFTIDLSSSDRTVAPSAAPCAGTTRMGTVGDVDSYACAQSPANPGAPIIFNKYLPLVSTPIVAPSGRELQDPNRISDDLTKVYAFATDGITPGGTCHECVVGGNCTQTSPNECLDPSPSTGGTFLIEGIQREFYVEGDEVRINPGTGSVNSAGSFELTGKVSEGLLAGIGSFGWSPNSVSFELFEGSNCTGTPKKSGILGAYNDVRDADLIKDDAFCISFSTTDNALDLNDKDVRFYYAKTDFSIDMSATIASDFDGSVVTHSLEKANGPQALHIFNIGSHASLKMSKSVSGDVMSGYMIGSGVTFLLDITNTSSGIANTITVTDDLSSTGVLVWGDNDAGTMGSGCTVESVSTTNPLTIKVKDGLGSGKTCTLSLNAVFTGYGCYTNTASGEQVGTSIEFPTQGTGVTVCSTGLDNLKLKKFLLKTGVSDYNTVTESTTEAFTSGESLIRVIQYELQSNGNLGDADPNNGGQFVLNDIVFTDEDKDLELLGNQYTVDGSPVKPSISSEFKIPSLTGGSKGYVTLSGVIISGANSKAIFSNTVTYKNGGQSATATGAFTGKKVATGECEVKIVVTTGTNASGSTAEVTCTASGTYPTPPIMTLLNNTYPTYVGLSVSGASALKRNLTGLTQSGTYKVDCQLSGVMCGSGSFVVPLLTGNSGSCVIDAQVASGASTGEKAISFNCRDLNPLPLSPIAFSVTANSMSVTQNGPSSSFSGSLSGVLGNNPNGTQTIELKCIYTGSDNKAGMCTTTVTIPGDKEESSGGGGGGGGNPPKEGNSNPPKDGNSNPPTNGNSNPPSDGSSKGGGGKPKECKGGSCKPKQAQANNFAPGATVPYSAGIVNNDPEVAMVGIQFRDELPAGMKMYERKASIDGNVVAQGSFPEGRGGKVELTPYLKDVVLPPLKTLDIDYITKIDSGYNFGSFINPAANLFECDENGNKVPSSGNNNNPGNAGNSNPAPANKCGGGASNAAESGGFTPQSAPLPGYGTGTNAGQISTGGNSNLVCEPKLYDINITKKILSEKLEVGKSVKFEITIKNEGLRTVTGLVIKEQFSGLIIKPPFVVSAGSGSSGSSAGSNFGIVQGYYSTSSSGSFDLMSGGTLSGGQSVTIIVDSILTGTSFVNMVQACNYKDELDPDSAPCDGFDKDDDASIVSGGVDVASIGDRLWMDTDGNGLQNTGEKGISDVLVQLVLCNTDVIVGSGKTNSDGIYGFTNLVPNKYAVRFDISGLKGFTPTIKNAGTDDSIDSDGDKIEGKYLVTECITLSGGQNYLGQDQGMTLDFKNMTGLSFLSVTKTLVSSGVALGQPLIFEIKVTNDGIMGVTGVSVKDKFAGLSGLKIGTSMNNLNINAPSGTDITVRSGITLGGKAGGLGGNPCTGSDCPTTFGPTGSNQFIFYVSAILTSGSFSNYVQLCNYDANKEGPRPPIPLNKPCDNSTNQADDDSVSGAVFLGLIGDRVRNDTNADGLQSSGEAGVGGVKLELYACNATGTVLKTVNSATDGSYKFDALSSGSYMIKSTLASPNDKYNYTTAMVGSNRAIDSDAKLISGAVARTDCFPVSVGANVNTIDFGLVMNSVAIQVTKTTQNQYVTSGDVATFKIEIKSTGSGSIKKYDFLDKLPVGLTFDGLNNADKISLAYRMNGSVTGATSQLQSVCGYPANGRTITSGSISGTIPSSNIGMNQSCVYMIKARVITNETGQKVNVASVNNVNDTARITNNTGVATVISNPACNLITLSASAGDIPFDLNYNVSATNGSVRLLSSSQQVITNLANLSGRYTILTGGSYYVEYIGSGYNGITGERCLRPFVVKELSECVGLSVSAVNEKQYNLSCNGNFATSYSLVMEFMGSGDSKFIPYTSGGIISGSQGMMTIPWGLDNMKYRFRCIVNGNISYSLDKISAYTNSTTDQFQCPYKTKSNGTICAVENLITPMKNKINFDPSALAVLPDPIEYCSPSEVSTAVCVNGPVSTMLIKNYSTCEKVVNFYAPDLLITKSADKGAFTSGELITYTLNVQNIGSGTSKGLRVRDKAYGSFKIESVTGLPDTERFNFADYTALSRDYSGIVLNPGQSQQFKYTLRLLNASVNEIKNEASVLAFSGSNTESNYNNNTTTNIISKQGNSTIGDFVRMDTNKNGSQDAGEVGIKNLQVQLLNCSSLSPLFVTFTDTNGLYKFSGIGSGSYRILVQVPDTYRISPKNVGTPDKDSNIDPTTNMSECFTLTQGQIRTDIDAALYIDPTIPPQNINCGNGKIEPQYGEQCDGNAVGSDAMCKNCQIIKNNISICGNSVIEQGEDCEVGNVPAGKTCYNCKLTENSVCGDGKVSGYEECDINTPSKAGFQCIGCVFVPNAFATCGNSKQELGEACDLGSANGTDALIPAGPNAGKKCTAGCNIINVIGPNNPNNPGQVILSYEPPSCTELDPPAAMEGEYFPFWWDIDDANVVTSCTADGQVLRDSMNCVFDLYAGKGGTTSPIKTFATACYNVSNFDGSLLSIFNSKTADKYGKAQIMLDPTLVNGKYGEYKLRLKKIDYKVCKGTGVNNGSVSPFNTFNDSYDETICEYNFTITRPYLMQIGGLVSSNATDSLFNFYGFSSNEGTSNILAKYGVKLENVPLDQYAGSSNLNYLVDSFTDKYNTLAVENLAAGANAYKVPGKEIYVYRGAITYDESKFDTSKPKTIIVKDGDLKIIGNSKGSTLFIVPNGNIIISTNDCNSTQVLNGIFITKNSILSDRNYINNNLANTWCEKGNLEIRGLVVGKGLQDLVSKRRSVLDNRFVKDNKKDAVINGASVLIKSNDSIFNAGIPGLDEFNKELSSYKR